MSEHVCTCVAHLKRLQGDVSSHLQHHEEVHGTAFLHEPKRVLSLCPGMVLGSFFKSCHFMFMWTQRGCNRAAKIVALDWTPDQCVLSDSHGSFDTPGRWHPRLRVPSLPPLPLYAQPFSASHGVPDMVCPIWLCWGT